MCTKKDEQMKAGLLGLLAIYVLFLGLVFWGIFAFSEEFVVGFSITTGILGLVLVVLIFSRRKDISSDEALEDLKRRLERLRKY
ncbi:MAG: hypothetical protein GXP63_01600 [DPANN group archaeon]|nr:hypothetical protein [DPANN group archaeon]